MSTGGPDSADSALPDFASDPSDPLYMLLNNAHDTKPDAPFGFLFPMDLGFDDPSFSAFVDPNALFVDGKEQTHSAPAAPIQPQDLLNPSFHFASPTLSSASASTAESTSGFIPSSPSSQCSARASPPVHRSTADAASTSSSGPFVASFQSHLPGQLAVPSTPSPPPPIHTARGPQTHVINTAGTGRPKTSHTTIERRYRTNLNARIQSLKAAVPALCVLDQNYRNDEYKVDDRGYIDGVKVARKGSKANVLGKAVEYIRVLKRREARLRREQDGLRSLIRGFPGGQNILTEWEMECLKNFGGAEKDEIDNEGTEDASDDEDGDGDDDGDTSERARKKPKIEPSKKEKRKIAPAAPIPMAPGSEVPVAAPGVVQKRKRGRPRKIQPSVPPPTTPAAPVLFTDPGQQGIVVPSKNTQPQQYLLAVFALFSFLNSPSTSTQPVTHHHTHQGSVLSHAISSPSPAQPVIRWTWNDVIQVVHLFASMAVFISIVIPWIPIPRRVHWSRVVPFASIVYQAYTNPTREASDPVSPDVSDDGSEPDSSSTEYTVRATKVSDPLADALGFRSGIDELENLMRALNVNTGFMGVVRGSLGSMQAHTGFENRREQRGWTRLAELLVLSPEKTSMSVRWQVYNRLSHHFTSPAKEVASETLISDLCTVALLAQSLPFAESRSQALWGRAGGLADSVEVPAYQRLVLSSMTVEDAVDCLAISKSIHGSSPIASLASHLLRERLHSHAVSLFVHRVSQGAEDNVGLPSTEDSKTWSATLSYGRSLCGDIGLLCDAFANAWQDRWFHLDMDDLKVDAVNEDVLALIRATFLYNQVFASPSAFPRSKADTTQSRADVMLQLRRALGSDVFEGGGEPSTDGLPLEDARDRVVDMIVDLQREERNWTG